MNRTIGGPLGQVKASEFQKAYGDFCRSADERPIPSKDLPTELQRRGFGYRRSKATRLYEGIELPVTPDDRFRENDHDFG